MLPIITMGDDVHQSAWMPTAWTASLFIIPLEGKAKDVPLEDPSSLILIRPLMIR